MSQAIEKDPLKQRTTPPKMWNVILVNDDFTTFEFVIALLMKVFQKSSEQAQRITMDIHQKGKGVAGQYTHDIALTKQAMALAYAEQYEHPLQVMVEQA